MKRILISATLLALATSSTVAFASGSAGGSSHRNDWGTTVTKGTNSRISNERRLLARGRAQVRKHITCKSCKYYDNLDHETAPEIVQEVRAGRFEIKDNHRNAVLAYLNDRFGN